MWQKWTHGTVLACACFAAAGCGGEFAAVEAGTDVGLPSAQYQRFVTAEAERPVPAQLPEEPRLSDYVAYAALNNPGLEAAFNRWKAALERIPQVKALPDPRFTYRYYIEEVETRVGAQRQSLDLSQTFPWFGKLALRGDMAARSANTSRQQYETAKLRLFYRLKSAYADYYYLSRAIDITRENVQLLRQVEAVARTRYKAAAAEHPDVVRVQVELGKLDDRLRTLQDLRGPVVAKLNAALNRPPEATLPWPRTLPSGPVALDDGQALEWMEQNSPELAALDADVGRRRIGIELARKEYSPDFTLGLTYIDTRASVGGRHPSDDGKDPLVAMVSLNVPVWWDKYAAGVREARARHRSARLRRLEKRNSLAAAMKMALYRFRDAERKVALYRGALLPKAQEAIKVSSAAFRAGKASFTDVVDAQRILLEFELAFERAFAERHKSVAEIEMLAGREIPRSGNASPAGLVSISETAAKTREEERRSHRRRSAPRTPGPRREDERN
jgi:outer membrane protein TolC